MSILKYANPRGLPCLDSVSVTLTTDALQVAFADHPLFKANFQGLFLVRINQSYTAPSTAVPVQFVTSNVANSEINLTNVGGTNVTTSTLTATGIYLCFYDRPTNTLQLLSRTS